MTDPLRHFRTAISDRYRLESVLGQGAMATVYLSEDLRHDRRVAVKALRPEMAATVGAERFLNEIKIAANLTHPHILPVHDSGQEEGILYYVMPYVQGGSLRTRLTREGRLAPGEAIRVASEVTEALVYAHACGIVHRDIKPENILLQAGKALVGDFGIARAIGNATGITEVGLVVGSPPYMSPEQSLGDPVDGRADIYAVGSILYEMLTGAPTYAGPTVQTVLTKSLTEDPPPLRAVLPELPAELESTVSRAMARSPDDRYRSATELLDALQAVALRLRAPSADAGVALAPSRAGALFGVAAAAGLAALYGLMRQVGLPPWSFALAAGLTAIGLPLLILTSRTEGRRRAGAVLIGIRRWFTWRNWAIGGVLALFTWAAVATVLLVRSPRAADTARIPRIAVLPFENLGAAEYAYFAEGIAAEIRGELVTVADIRVIARESSDQYAGSGKSLRQIGEELDVDYLLTATVRWIAENDGRRRVELVPELIDARTGEIRWQQMFSAAFTDVIRMRPDIALRVADALDVAIGPAKRREVAAPHTTDAAAYDTYLRAREESSRRDDAAALRQGINLFERVIAIDSMFVDAWSGLSSTASALYVATGDQAVGEQARMAAERALEIAPDEPDGHVALVRYFLWVAGDAAQAVAAATRGLRVSPGYADLLMQAAMAEQQLGRWEAALTHITEAERLDPRSAVTAGAKGYLLLRLRRYGEAHEAYDRALAIDSTNLSIIIQKAMVYLGEADLQAAQASIRRAARRVDETQLALHLATYYDLYWILTEAQQDLVLRLPPSAYLRDRLEWSLVRMQIYAFRGEAASARAYADSARLILEPQLRIAPDRSESLTSLGLALAYLGRPADAIRAAQRATDLLSLDREAIDYTYAAHQLIRVYLLAGESDRALDRLESLLAVPYYVSAGWLRVDPTFDPLRGNPRFERLAAPPDTD